MIVGFTTRGDSMRSTGNTDDILSALKASRLFSGIGDAELSKFVECSGTVLRSYPAGCVILREGDIPCDIYGGGGRRITFAGSPERT